MRFVRLVVVSFLVAHAASAVAQTLWQSNGSGHISNTNTGNVGVGATTTPTAKLTVFGSGSYYAASAARFDLYNTGSVYGMHFGDDGTWRLIDPTGAWRIMVDQSGGRYVYVADHLSVGTATAGQVQAVEVGNWLGGGAGNIAFPSQTGNVDFSQTNATKGVFRWIVGGAERMRLGRDGSLGLGTGSATPADRLHVKDGHIRIEHSDPTAALSGIFFYEGPSLFGFINQRGTVFPGIEALQFNVGNAHPNGSFGLWAGGGRRITISPAGRMGIGMEPSATHSLSVNGDAHFTGKVTGGNIVAKYQDIAEWVPSTEELEAGTVVVLDPRHSNHVLASSQAYDTSVAGVVSEQPGLTLGEEGPSKAMIATTGRVRVRVDARQQPIRIGDLLATGSIPGTAMKSEPMEINGRPFHQPGTIIGKALEPLDSGVGEILVLLSMQ